MFTDNIWPHVALSILHPVTLIYLNLFSKVCRGQQDEALSVHLKFHNVF